MPVGVVAEVVVVSALFLQPETLLCGVPRLSRGNWSAGATGLG